MEEILANSTYETKGTFSIGWSFPKEARFRSNTRSIDIEYLNPNSTLSPRSTSIGFGRRWNPEIQSAKGKPPPGSYEIPSTFSTIVGPKLVKSTIQQLSKLRHLTPGPGTYDTSSHIGRNSPKFSFRGRLTLPKRSEIPPPGTYNPQRTLTEFSGYSKIGFGYGTRTFPTVEKRESPGPGSYSIMSEFDKARKTVY